MFKKIFGKKDEGEDGIKPVKANLGEENRFYYNKELKSWVVRGEEHLVEEKKNIPPPPKRPTTSEYGSRVDSTASLSSQSYNSGNMRKNLYTATPGLNIKKVPENSNGVIPIGGLHQPSNTQTLNTMLLNSTAGDKNIISNYDPPLLNLSNTHDGNYNNNVGIISSDLSEANSINNNTFSQNSVNNSAKTVLSNQYSDKTSINTNNKVLRRIELPPSIPTLPNSLMSNKVLNGKLLKKTSSIESQSSLPYTSKTNENKNIDSDHGNITDKLNSESDNLDISYTQDDMRQRQRIRPLSSKSNNSADFTEIDNQKRNDNKILDYISIFGYIYDNKLCKIIDYNGVDQVKKLDEICCEIKEIKLKELYNMVSTLHNSILDSSKDYEALIEMILNIGTVTNKSFQDISSTINTAMSNSDEIEKELIKTKKLYNDLLGKYKGLYKQYESDMVNLRSELENEKNINNTNNKEYDDKIKNLKKEYMDNETSKNELLNQYYSYIENIQEKYDKLQKECVELDDNYKKTKEDIKLLNNELALARNDMKVKEDECKIKINNLEELNGKLSNELELKINDNNELKLEYENKINEIKTEYEQEIKLIEKYNIEQDNEICNLKNDIEKINIYNNELIRQYEDEISEIRAKLNGLENTNDELKNELELVNNEKNNLSKNMTDEISKLKIDNDNILNELNNKINENNNMVSEISQLKIENENIISELKKENEMYIKKIDNINERNNEYESNIANIKNNYESRIDKLNEHISMLENTATKVDDEWRTRQSHLETNYEQLYSQYISLSNEKEEYDSLNDKYNNLKTEYNDLFNANERCTSELESKLKECENNMSYISELELKLNEYENSRNYISDLELKLNDYENDKKYISDLESKLSEFENCKKYISDLELKLNDYENSKKYISELESSIERLKHYQSDNTVSNDESNRLKLENERLKDTNEAVYIKLEAFSRDIDMLNNQLEWIRRYSPETYNSMLENTDSYLNNFNNNDISDISL
ncbi:hypothetical protein FG379_001769 [Cryptosporidium bovis]|uniref:uncharacterized protein n=1 Tax=Cryptosporidium bovis TaxID=310047 RepID=UPI00351A576B|nr:hypothetical protein FG379_001769 [Cryptosporidium bovis]